MFGRNRQIATRLRKAHIETNCMSADQTVEMLGHWLLRHISGDVLSPHKGRKA